MALFSFLKGRGDARSSSSKNAPGAQPVSAGLVDEVRTRARRRLIGAGVLVTAAVVGLPLIFESKPRPVAVDTPISVVRPDGLPAVTVPAPKSTTPDAPAVAAAPQPSTAAPAEITPRVTTPSGTQQDVPKAPPAPAPDIVTETPADAGRELAPPPASAASKASRPVEAARPAVPAKVEERKASAAKPKDDAADKPVRKPEASGKTAQDKLSTEKADAARAKALLEGHEAPAKEATKSAAKAPAPTAGGSGKFVVQVGAFSQASSAEAALSQVDKLGMKAYAQDVETAAGKRTRVRLGPFATREEAERAAQRLKAAGQSAAVLPQ